MIILLFGLVAFWFRHKALSRSMGYAWFIASIWFVGWALLGDIGFVAMQLLGIIPYSKDVLYDDLLYISIVTPTYYALTVGLYWFLRRRRLRRNAQNIQTSFEQDRS